MKDSKLYCCFSVPLKEFLYNHGVKYELVGLHPKTQCTMWIYIKDEKLKELLNEWSLGSKS